MGINFSLLAGGEPMMRKDILEQVAEVKDMIFPIFTNGTLIGPSYLEFLRKNLNMVPIISLEGTAIGTDERRGQGVFKRAMQSMEMLKSENLFFGTSITVTAWWETAHNIRKEEFMRQKAENTRRDLQEKLALQTFQSWSAMNESYSLIAVRRHAMEQAGDNFTEVKNYFEAGMNSMKDYLEAQTLLQQARNELVDQVIDYLLQRKQYGLQN